jgi:hypothetical protein
MLGPAVYLHLYISPAEARVTHAGRANYKQARPEARNKVTTICVAVGSEQETRNAELAGTSS